MNLTRRFFIKAILGTFAYVTLPRSMSTFEMPEPGFEIWTIDPACIPKGMVCKVTYYGSLSQPDPSWENIRNFKMDVEYVEQ